MGFGGTTYRKSLGVAVWLGVVVLAFLWASCTPKPIEQTAEKPVVVTTTGLIADMARTLLDTHATVVALMGPGVDPHLYKASQQDLATLRQADLVLANGLHLEGKLQEILQRLGRTQKVVFVGQLLPPDRLIHSEAFPGAYDPHIWFDALLWREAAEQLSDTLQWVFPALAETVSIRTRAYLTSLTVLDSMLRTELGNVPSERRVMVTAHDAFAYFGRAYGWEVRGLQGLSTATEVGLRDIESLAIFLVQRRIPAIFVESSVNPRAIEAVVTAAKARGHRLRIGGLLYSDALGVAGGPAGDYPSMFRTNVQTLVTALK